MARTSTKQHRLVCGMDSLDRWGAERGEDPPMVQIPRGCQCLEWAHKPRRRPSGGGRMSVHDLLMCLTMPRYLGRHCICKHPVLSEEALPWGKSRPQVLWSGLDRTVFKARA